MTTEYVDEYHEMIQSLHPIVEVGLYERGMWEQQPQINVKTATADVQACECSSKEKSDGKPTSETLPGKPAPMYYNAFRAGTHPDRSINLQFRVVVDNDRATPTLYRSDYWTVEGVTMEVLLDDMMTWCVPQCYKLFHSKATSAAEILSFKRDMYLLVEEDPSSRRLDSRGFATIVRGDEDAFARHLSENISTSNRLLKFEIHFASPWRTIADTHASWHFDKMTTWTDDEAFQCEHHKLRGYQWEIDSINYLPHAEFITESQRSHMEAKRKVIQPSTVAWFSDKSPKHKVARAFHAVQNIALSVVRFSNH